MKYNFKRGGITIHHYEGERLIDRTIAKDESHFNSLTSDRFEHKIVLECSTKGDKRFSAFGARVEVFGVNDFIEFHYFFAKKFNDYRIPKNPQNFSWKNRILYIKAIKGAEPDYLMINGHRYDIKYMHQWYHLLWIKYLDNNPHLVEYLKLFDDYNDIFKGKSGICQADSIRKYIKDGRKSIVDECKELINEINKNK